MNGPGTLTYFFRHSWDWDLSKIIGCIALVLIYFLWTRFKPLYSSLLYLAGVAILFLSLASPLDALGDEYLFSAHMLQHFLLLMIVPVLMVMGMPERQTRSLLEPAWIKKTEKLLSQPVFAWVLANSVLWIWHLPKLYTMAVEHEGIHIFQHLTFLVSATIFWWPILAPTSESRLPPRFGMAYTFSAAFSNMVLSIILTFMNEPLYEPYLSPEDSWKILGILRTHFHLDPVADQKLGGILMWIFGSTVFLAVLLVQLAYWYNATEVEPEMEIEQV